MKMITTLIVAFLFTACGAHEEPTPLVAVSRPASASLLEHFRETAGHSESLLLRVSTAALQSGITLPSPAAERCWSQEKARPVVREACLLLWAGSGEDNAALAGALRENLSHSRPVAFAAVIKKSFIAQLSLAELLGLLQRLSGDPVWVKSMAVEAWVESQGRPDILTTEQILPWIQPEPNSGLRDWAAALRTRFRLRPGSWHEGIARFCDGGAAGEARLRCWRLLGFMATHPLEAQLREAIKLYLPSSRDPDWAYFSAVFPSLAKRLQENVIQEQK
jgi:hypothetical protein